MDKKVVLIMGGSGGIGFHIAIAFLHSGAYIIISSRSDRKLQEAETHLLTSTVNQLSLEDPPQIHTIAGDISNFDDVQCIVDEVIEKYGKIDVVINASGVQSPIGSLWENNPADWTNTVLTNLVGSFNLCRAAIPFMKEADRGVIILFSGGGAAYARPFFSAYGVGKTGVLRLVETINEELSGVPPFIYAIAPGAVKTDMIEEVIQQKDKAGTKAYEEAINVMKGDGVSPEKAAELCLFLVKETPRCFSGKLIHVNEPYKDYVKMFEGKEMGEKGLLRRMPYL